MKYFTELACVIFFRSNILEAMHVDKLQLFAVQVGIELISKTLATIVEPEVLVQPINLFNVYPPLAINRNTSCFDTVCLGMNCLDYSMRWIFLF